MKWSQIPKNQVVSPITMAAIEATNNRKAVKHLRFFLRWALSELQGAAANGLAAENARKLLDETTRRKMQGW